MCQVRYREFQGHSRGCEGISKLFQVISVVFQGLQGCSREFKGFHVPGGYRGVRGVFQGISRLFQALHGVFKAF